ncbi:MAG: metallophosphoesterase [Fimbriimonas sp.]
MAQKITRRQAIGGLAAVLASVGTYGLLTSRDLRVNRQELRLKRWGAPGFRIVQISDVHVNDAAQLATARRAVDLAVQERADLIVFTGDFVNYDSEQALSNIPLAFEGLEGARCPCLAILGNHDYQCGSVDQVVAQAAKTKLNLLRNRRIDLGGVVVSGLEDAYQKPDYELAPYTKSSLVLLHEPDYVQQLPGHVSLMLAGHSHGGEICLPGGIPLYTPTGSRRYTAGFYDRPTVPLFVSRGTATLGPGRTYCPAEINVLTLNPA